MTFDLAAGPRIYNLKQVANKPDERPFESHAPIPGVSEEVQNI